MSLKQRFPLLQQTFDIFLLDAEPRGLIHSTLTYYKQRVGHFIRWCDAQDVKYINEISTNHLRRHLSHAFHTLHRPNPQQMLWPWYHALLAQAVGIFRVNHKFPIFDNLPIPE